MSWEFALGVFWGAFASVAFFAFTMAAYLAGQKKGETK